MSKTIEQFNPKYISILEVTPSRKRWEAILRVYKEDYNSFRVLFDTETVGLIEHWEEPEPQRLVEMIRFRMGGGRFGVHVGNLTKLIEPVWPLEMAKAEVGLFQAFASKYSAKNYFLSYTKLWCTALLQAWWAFETLVNDLGGIILEQRKETLSNVERDLFEEMTSSIDTKGMIVRKSAYEPLESRILFIYRTLTSSDVDRGGPKWQHLMRLKRARDTYTHRIGK